MPACACVWAAAHVIGRTEDGNTRACSPTYACFVLRVFHILPVPVSVPVPAALCRPPPPSSVLPSMEPALSVEWKPAPGMHPAPNHTPALLCTALV
ncbi:hypothetical protein AcV7_004214 [Taiwanofungus camphoratus]|nr:hypothetical protein AcV7_004214 [Antrodia cinnamomea]